MRLLQIKNNGSLVLKQFDTRHEIPPYAILSHTWGRREALYDDLGKSKVVQDINGKFGATWQKVQFCVEQAKSDGLGYFWLDTCCIDRSNDLEVEEAVGAAYKWYKNSKRCYVLLLDVESDSLEGDGELAFRKGKWFTRSWTVPELLAPASMKSFSRSGTQLGDKGSLKNIIHEVIRIPVKALSKNDMSDFGVIECLSWAEDRHTTREEDSAYCLLGLFSCSMPIIYGEGRKRAWERLKWVIQEQRSDNICRWLSPSDPSTNYQKARRRQVPGTGVWLPESPEFKQ